MERVAANPARRGLPHVLRGRSGECATLDGLLEGVRGGRSAALVVYGEAGVGKTALLRYAAEMLKRHRFPAGGCYCMHNCRDRRAERSQCPSQGRNR